MLVLTGIADLHSFTTAQLAERVPGLAAASDEDLGHLLKCSQVITLARDEFVFHTGGPCRNFLILLEGRVRVQLLSHSGREVSLYRIGPGGSCILTTSCLLSDEHYPAEAIAESDLRALAISADGFQSLLERSAWFRKFVFDGFSSRLTNIIHKIEDIAFTSIDARLASLLLQLDKTGVREVTHQRLAAELGTAREVVSRHLKRLESAKCVQLGRGQVAVIDRRKLSALAAPALGD